MKLLWVATKAPWPPRDGGRLLLWNTLGSLARAGVSVTLVAPFLGPRETLAAAEDRLREVCRPILVPSRLRRAPWHFLLAHPKRRPWTLVRHENRRVRQRVAEELAGNDYQVVVAEQLHALAQVPEDAAVPVVLRAQNVESELWRAQSLSESHPAPLRWWLARQARWLAEAEGNAVRRCAATAALTEQDAEVLETLGERPKENQIEVIPAAVDVELAPGPELEGRPALVLFGSVGWKPNSEGSRSFLEQSWPSVRQSMPGAVLHLFGDLLSRGDSGDERVRVHPAPDGSATALARGSILLVPLQVASGVRMKILEAWARGVVVVASPAAARGLVADSGRELVIAAAPDDWAAAISRAAENYVDLAAAARGRLHQTYAPELAAETWLQLVGRLVGQVG